MHPTKVAILDLFQKQKLQPLSTSTIVESLYESQLSTSDNNKQVQAKLHRQLLHHLNMLVSERILRVHSVVGKGEKLFVPNVGQNEELIVRGKEKIILTAKSSPVVPIEQFEEEKVVYRYDPISWTERLNAILYHMRYLRSLDQLTSLLRDTFSQVNDVIALNDFESVIQSYPLHEVIEAVDRIAKTAKDYNRQICIIIDATNIVSDELVDQFFLLFTKLSAERVNVVFDVTPQELLMHKELFEHIALYFARFNKKLNIKNDEYHKSPYIVGKAGPYTIDPKLWEEHIQKETFGVAITSLSVVVDVRKLLTKHKTAKDIANVFLTCARSLCLGASAQRQERESYFRHIISRQEFSGPEFFSYATCLIRMLNYQQHLDDSFLTLLTDIKSQVQEFANTQRVIFLSCGMPTEFRINFGQAYRRFSDTPQLFEDYEEIMVRNAQDLSSIQVQEKLRKFEELAKTLPLFEIRIEREGRATMQDVLSELSILLHSYRFALICYHFKPQEAHMPLSTYLQ